jgi:Cupin domain
MNGTFQRWCGARRLALGTVVALSVVAAGGIAWRVAWATPGSGNVVTLLAGPTLLGEIDAKAETDGYELELKTKGLSDGYVQHNLILPGGYSGWHSHPGPVFVLITAGTASVYDATDPDKPRRYAAGTGFVEEVGDVHNVVNEGTTNVELVAFVLVPMGAPRRIDKPAP